MDGKNKFLSDVVLHKTLKVLGIVLLFLAVMFMASQFTDLWLRITGAISRVLVPVSLAWLISLVIYPIIKLLERRGVGPRALSVAIVYIATGVVVGGAIYLLGPAILNQVESFFTNEFNDISAYVSDQDGLRADFPLGTDVFDWISQTVEDTQIVENTIVGFADNITNSISTTFLSIVTVLFILPILLLFYLLDYELVNDSLRSLVPQKYEKASSELGTRLNQTVGAYIRGQLFLMLAIGTVATIIYKLIGLQYFFVFGLIVGITNIIPYFGAVIAMIPVVIFTVITKDAPNPLIIVGVNVVLQFIEGNIFQPIIMGKQLEIHPLLIIVSILFFGSLFGTLGVIFASPMAATIRVLIEFYKERRNYIEGNTSRDITHET